MWTIYGLDAPTELGGVEHLIGELITTSANVESLYGDQVMLIRHQLATDDMALMPEWTPYYKKYAGEKFEEGDCGLFNNQPMKPTCPFAFLMW